MILQKECIIIFVNKIKKIAYKSFVKYLCKYSPFYASKFLYWRTTKRRLNLANPKDFNEKLQWLKLYWQHPLITKCADKYGIYEYFRSKGEDEVLNELYAVYNHPSEINWDKLPDKFVIKCTHGCGYNIICDNKEALDKKSVYKKLEKWMSEKYGLFGGELHYDKIKPRIIVEKYIETDEGLLPNDYKIYCFNGKAKLVLICTERANNVKLDFVDLNWNRINIGVPEYQSKRLPTMPKCFNKMVEYAEKYSEPFPFVRMDFYDFNGKPVLGEMTFTPAACMANYYNKEGLILLGKMLVLPNEIIV